MADLQVLQNKAARIILDLPPRASVSDALAKRHGNNCCIGELNTPLFLFLNQLMVHFSLPFNIGLTVTFMIMKHDPGIT